MSFTATSVFFFFFGDGDGEDSDEYSVKDCRDDSDEDCEDDSDEIHDYTFFCYGFSSLQKQTYCDSCFF